MKKYIAIGIVLAISIGINIWFLSGKGIVINNNTTNHQEQYQQQWQGQMLINQFMVQGDKIEWKLITCQTVDAMYTLEKLHPISSLYSKVTVISSPSRDYTIILYPDIFTKTKEVEVKK